MVLDAAGTTSEPSWYLKNTTNTTWSSLDDDLYDGGLPDEMRFNEGHIISIVTYSILMVVSGIGNLTVFISLLRRRRQKRQSRVHLMLLHLAAADLVVTFVMMPLEIAWASTVSWWAGDTLCRLLAFCRIFGLFLSSFVLVCISIDRYFAVLHPMGMHDAYRRGKIMLAAAWALSTACSLPQIVIFHVESHSHFTWFEQCVTYHSFPSRGHELAYYIFGMVGMYGLPLAVIIASYGAILVALSRKSRECAEQIRTTSGEDKLRRSGIGNLDRAKERTLKMTIIIVAVFILCWTPYYVMCLWYWFDQKSAEKVDPRVQRGLFLFASSNSCMNPIVYGMFSLNCGSRRRGGSGKHRRPKSRGRDWSDRTIIEKSSTYDNNYTCVSEATNYDLPTSSSSTKRQQKKPLLVMPTHVEICVESV